MTSNIDIEKSKLVKLGADNPQSLALYHVIDSHMCGQEAFVVSQDILANLCEFSTKTLQRALIPLLEQNLIHVYPLGKTKSICAYMLSNCVEWSDDPESSKYIDLTARIVISKEDQVEVSQKAISTATNPIAQTGTDEISPENLAQIEYLQKVDSISISPITQLETDEILPETPKQNDDPKQHTDKENAENKKGQHMPHIQYILDNYVI